MHISLMEYEDNSEDEDEDDEDDDDDQVQDVDAARSRTESNMPPPLARSFTANNAISRSSPDNTNANIPTDEMVSPTPPPKPRPLLPAGPDLSPIASRKPLPSISATSATSSVGEQDKHVLKDVGKVEMFVQDMNRKVAEEQFLFPKLETVDIQKGGSQRK
ncbi:hypothetical protein A4X13_0g3278 [Tilletia indica]|uniref:Uncharacterized protein n=1 Tax=Tilletia indica TaxID=43049 RepID=A0A8T8T3R2_9BASI|nr:hypothetical protein A4X13_0g3278 [Tilletia indica]